MLQIEVRKQPPSACCKKQGFFFSWMPFQAIGVEVGHKGCCCAGMWRFCPLQTWYPSERRAPREPINRTHFPKSPKRGKRCPPQAPQLIPPAASATSWHRLLIFNWLVLWSLESCRHLLRTRPHVTCKTHPDISTTELNLDTAVKESNKVTPTPQAPEF